MTNIPLSKMANRIVLSGSRDNTVTFKCERQFVDLKHLKQQGVPFIFSKETKYLTLSVPKEFSHLSSAQVCSDWKITVSMTPLRQAPVAAHIKFAHSATPRVVYPPCGPNEIIVFMTMSNAVQVPEGAVLSIDGNTCTTWIVAVNPSDVTRGNLLPTGHQQWFLNGVLPFTLFVDKVTGYNDSMLETRVDDITDMFERANKASCEALEPTYDDIAEQGRIHMKEQERLRGEHLKRDGRPQVALCFDTQPVGLRSSTSVNTMTACLEDNVKPVNHHSHWDDHFEGTRNPMFDTFKSMSILSSGVSSRVWAEYDDTELLSMSAPPSPPPFSSNDVPNALSGVFVNVLTQDDQKAQKKAKRVDQKAKRLEEERLKKKAEEAEEAKRLQDLADIERVEQERKEAEAKALEDKALYSALVNEFQSIDPVVLIAAGIETLEQWLTNPDEYRAKIAELLKPAHQKKSLYVTLHTPHKAHSDGLSRQALQLGITLTPYQNGNHWCLDISAEELNRLIVFVQNQHIWVSAKEEREKGYRVQLGRNSYSALMKIRPELKPFVQHALSMQEQLDHRRQGVLPLPDCQQCYYPPYYPFHTMGAYPLVSVPVYGHDGTFMTIQCVAPFPPPYA